MSTLVKFEPQVDVLRASTRDALLRQVGRAVRRGELGAVDIMVRTNGGWAVKVYRLKPARRRHVLAYAAGSTVLTLAGLVALGWYLVTPVMQLLAAFVPVLLGGLATRLAIGWLLRDRGCTITHTRG